MYILVLTFFYIKLEEKNSAPNYWKDIKHGKNEEICGMKAEGTGNRQRYSPFTFSGAHKTVWRKVPHLSVCLNLFGRNTGPFQRKTQKKRTHPEMLRLGLEPVIPVFERQKAVHGLDCAVSATFPRQRTVRCHF